jgi:hypothetical protein
VVGTARDRALSFNGGPMWFNGIFEMLAQLVTEQGNYGKVENTRWEGRCVVYFYVRSSEGGSPCLS